jgi:hypothetical protein
LDLLGAIRVWDKAEPEERIGLGPVIASKIYKYKTSGLKDDATETAVDGWIKEHK